MADGSQAIGPNVPPFNVKPCLTQEQFDDVSLSVSNALALSDVLTVMANDGDVGSLHDGSLAATLSMLCGILHQTRKYLDCVSALPIATEGSQLHA